MIISQKRRACYSEDGQLQKMDVLHSVRRKDVDPSEILGIEDSPPISDRSSMLVEMFQLSMYLVLVVSAGLLISSMFISKDNGSQPPPESSSSFSDSQSQIDLKSRLQVILNNQAMSLSDLLQKLNSHDKQLLLKMMQCNGQQGNIHCHFDH